MEPKYKAILDIHDMAHFIELVFDSNKTDRTDFSLIDVERIEVSKGTNIGSYHECTLGSDKSSDLVDFVSYFQDIPLEEARRLVNVNTKA